MELKIKKVDLPNHFNLEHLAEVIDEQGGGKVCVTVSVCYVHIELGLGNMIDLIKTLDELGVNLDVAD